MSLGLRAMVPPFLRSAIVAAKPPLPCRASCVLMRAGQVIFGARGGLLGGEGEYGWTGRTDRPGSGVPVTVRREAGEE